jgi:acetyl-CoA carboxylase biotin carboxyl carrier protein
MNQDDIRQLAELMRDTGLRCLEYSDGATSVKLTRDTRPPRGGSYDRPADARTRLADGPAEEACERPAPRGGIVTVASPMVGVFYCAPGEGEKPYVAPGDTVRAGDVLCIIEAMKMMNEITAERDGVVVEVCASNKQTVDYGHPLFRLRPAGS